jgi:hypothetical protein
MLTFLTGTVIGGAVAVVAGPEIKAVVKKLYATAKVWLDQ